MHSTRKAAPVRTLRAGLTSLVGVTLLLAVLPGVASAAPTGTTTTTFTLTGGSISISVPRTTVNFGAVSVSAGSITAQLGTITVHDGRGLLNGSWTSTVSSSRFVAGGQSPAEPIDVTSVSYWSGAPTATSGVGALLGGEPTPGAAVAISAAQTAFTGGSLIGNNSASWNPTLITTPSAAVVGTYTGTVTHTVA
jgi:hypothetical protein